jgi:hypothetical protein
MAKNIANTSATCEIKEQWGDDASTMESTQVKFQEPFNQSPCLQHSHNRESKHCFI